MFLKSLNITSGNGAVIREIQFRLGLNLIVDETPILSGQETGNNVGKTTVLKLIDVCLGANKAGIYTDYENKKNEHKIVKDYLVNKRILISLVLVDDFNEMNSRLITIERNFLLRKDKIQRMNGIDMSDVEFDEALTNMLFPGHYGKKPTFRQIISHNIRYKDASVNNILKNLDVFTREDEYETLYLFLFGCNFDQGDAKQDYRSQIDLEEKFKKRLESEQTRSAYETALTLLQSEIHDIEIKKDSFKLNPNFESDLSKLNSVKYRINLTTSEISRLELRKDLILEAEREMQLNVSEIDTQQLKQIYNQAKYLVSGIQKTFQELYDFHNQMVKSKIRFIVQDLPNLKNQIYIKNEVLKRLLAEEIDLRKAITQTDSFEGLEQLAVELNAKHQKKGEYESILNQLNTVESKLLELNANLSTIDNELFSETFVSKVRQQVNKFNRYFSSVSSELYNEKYALKVETKLVKNRRLYEFSPFNLNFSSGKKQGEISCFDIAYTLFADEENIPCMHFLLNDKKELMHDNQLQMIARLVNSGGIQFVASILKDKLPDELNKDEFIILKLSQDNKLFRIE